MGFLDLLFGDSDEGEAKAVDSLEQQRIDAINKTKDAIYQAWRKAILEKTTAMYKISNPSDTVYAPKLENLEGPMPNLNQREYESVIKKAAHDAFDEMGLKVGDKVSFNVTTDAYGGNDRISIHIYY